MPSLQLLQLTEWGRSLLASRRKALLYATGIFVAGGAAAYLQSRSNARKLDFVYNYNGNSCEKEKEVKVVKDSKNDKKAKKKKSGLKSLRVITAILLSNIGLTGARNLFALATVIVLRTALGNRSAKVQGFLFRAAFLCRVPSFIRLISEDILLRFLLSTLRSTSNYIMKTIRLRFRKILTKFIHAYYFENMAYYKISHVDRRITNPVQQIASDIPRFCAELSELLEDDLTAIADTLLYTWRLCSYASPKYIFWILAYVMSSSALIGKFSPAFGKLMSKEQQLEGEYRQLHSRMRTHAESVAFYGGEAREASNIQEKFKALTNHMEIVLHDNWWFNMIQDFLLKYLSSTVALVLIMEPFFTGDLRPDTSALGRAEMLSNLRYHISVIKSLFQALGKLCRSSKQLNRISGYAERIHELMIISRELSAVNDRNGNNGCFSEAAYIEFSDVKVITPTGNALVKDLTLKVEPGSNLLITGPNGSGKSSLFRVLGGLWPLKSGHITKPGVGSDLNKEIFYVPQRPYTTVGTLRDQLIYPLTADQEVKPLTQDEMVELLKNVDLEHLVDRYPPGEEINWGDELSLGEQQRLGMARLFYHKPKFAILDECTSAVTTDMEKHFCDKVRAMGTSCITISHRPALVAFHDVVLSLDGEGGWSVHHKGDDLPKLPEVDITWTQPSESSRQTDAMTVQRAFANVSEGSAVLNSKAYSYISGVIAKSPSRGGGPLPVVPQLHCAPRPLRLRIAALFKILVPTVLDKQEVHLLAVAFLVVSRTWISDSIASLNGTTMRYVVEQDKASFIRLIGVSVLQCAASSFVAPSLRHLTARLALEWRIRLTQHLLKSYLRNNAFYKVFHASSKNVDADQRITRDLDKLTLDLSKLVTGMVKPTVDILWFTWRMKLLLGQRGVFMLYAYMLVSLGFLRTVAPDFGDLTSREQELEGVFRFMHERIRTHAESIAFFGGGPREKAMIETRFMELLDHSTLLLRKKWLFDILDDFMREQLPHVATWGLSLLYSINLMDDRASLSTQGDLANALRFLASVVSQSFLAFGDILDMQRKFLELSGGIGRIFELEELLHAAQSGESFTTNPTNQFNKNDDYISFSEVDVVTPAQKLLAMKLTCDIVPGKSLLLTGPNGSGKSSIFRVLRGLWPVANGRLTGPLPSVEEGGFGCGIFYVPQQPYTCLGTLRDQIIYPFSCEEAERRLRQIHRKGERSIEAKTTNLDTHLKTILDNVRLSYLLDRDECGWDAIHHWEDVLSLGEQQRLGMARLFFHRPRFGVLDECTNATSIDVEENLYRQATSMGITVITSSQRPALLPFHALELRLIDGDGNWELRPIGQ